MNLTSQIDQVLSEWPRMISDLKKIDSNLSRSPNKPPDYISAEQKKLIDIAKHLAHKINLKNNFELLTLEMFVEWSFNKHEPIYRHAKWYAMLGYLFNKYGSYKFPTRTSGDNRESQYYNMISLLRNTYRGKTKSITLDKNLLKLPKAKEWICSKNRRDKKIYSTDDWQQILDFIVSKYGYYAKPKSTSTDKDEVKNYQLLQRIKKAYKNGNLSNEILKLPKAKEWILNIKPSDRDIWQEILSFSINELGLYSKPRITSKNLQEKHFAIKIQNWRVAISKGISKQSPDKAVLNLPMAREWLLKEISKFHQALSKWPRILKLIKSNKSEINPPKAKSTDPLEKEFYSLIAYFKVKLKKAKPEEIKQILSLEKAEDLIGKNQEELRSHQKWQEMLQYLHNKYGFYKLPQSRSDDPREKAYYNFIFNHKRRIRKNGSTYKSILELPMAKEWLFD